MNLINGKSYNFILLILLMAIMHCTLPAQTLNWSDDSPLNHTANLETGTDQKSQFGTDGPANRISGSDNDFYISIATSPRLVLQPAALMQDFGSQNIDNGPTAAIEIAVINSGSSDLDFNAISIINDAEGSFSFNTAVTTASLTPGTTKTLSIIFDPSSIGAKTADLQILSNDLSSPTATIALAGTGSAPLIPLPEVAVFNEETELFDDASTISVGSTLQGNDALTLTFLVENNGAQGSELTPTNLSVSLPFLLIQSLDKTSIEAGESDTFVIGLPTGAAGTFNGIVSFNNNDNDENPFTFNVTGIIQPTSGTPEIRAYLLGIITVPPQAGSFDTNFDNNVNVSDLLNNQAN